MSSVESCSGLAQLMCHVYVGFFVRQIDMLTAYDVKRVLLAGPRTGSDYYSSVSFDYSLDDFTWQRYYVDGQSVSNAVLFDDGMMVNAVLENALAYDVSARYLLFHGEGENDALMQMEVYGCPSDNERTCVVCIESAKVLRDVRPGVHVIMRCLFQPRRHSPSV